MSGGAQQGGRRRFGGALAGLILAILALPGVALASVYWSQTGGFFEGRIGRAGDDGSHIRRNFIKRAIGPFSVAVDRRHIYWYNNDSGSIGRARIDGSRVDQFFIRNVDAPLTDIDVGGGRIYWTDAFSDVPAIGSAAKDGTDVRRDFIRFDGPEFEGYPTYEEPDALAVHGDYVYWTNNCPVCLKEENGSIGRARLDGSEATYDLIPELGPTSAPSGIDVGPSGIYFYDRGARAIAHASLDGLDLDPDLITGQLARYGLPLAINDRHIFWRHSGRWVARANLDGTRIRREFVKAGRSVIDSIAADTR